MTMYLNKYNFTVYLFIKIKVHEGSHKKGKVQFYKFSYLHGIVLLKGGHSIFYLFKYFDCIAPISITPMYYMILL